MDSTSRPSNDGTSSPEPVVTEQRAGEADLTPGERVQVDDRQDVVMEVTSSEGRPPSHLQRMAGWRWVAISLSAVAVGFLAWALLQGVPAGSIIGFGVGSAIFVLLASWPVWVAGVRRGKDESTARKTAVAELHGDVSLVNPPQALPAPSGVPPRQA